MLATLKRPFYHWQDAQHAVWKALFERQFPKIQAHAHHWYLEGHQILGLTADHIPDFAALDPLFQERVGWELVSTDVQYSDGQTWFEHLQQRKFLITEYIRDWDSLDYTPLPDIFHDAFGHLPFQIQPRYADLVQAWGFMELECPPEVRHQYGSIWWYTIEFGFIKEHGELKAFGTGLFSSYGEWDLAFSANMDKRPFNPQEIGQYKPSPHEMHKVLWVLEDFDQLEEFVARERQKYRQI